MSKQDQDGKVKCKKLRELPIWAEIEKKIKADVAIEEIARWIQEDMLMRTEIKRSSLERQLYRYKSSLPPSEIVREKPLHIRKAIEKLHRGINEIEEMQQLYLYQLKRISMDGATEEKINKLFSGQRKEIALAVDMLDKIIERKMELGLLDKEPDKLMVSGGLVTTGLGDLDNMDEDTATRLGMFSKKLIEAVGKIKKKEKKEDREFSDEIVFEEDDEDV